MDELHTEEDARMDALEDRTRALAARVDALTKERDTARASADRWHGVAHQMEVERDAAARAKEAVEADRATAARTCDLLRVQIERMRRDTLAQAADDLSITEELNSLRAQLSEAREREGKVRPLLAHWVALHDGAVPHMDFEREIHAIVTGIREWLAALSPSPATGVVEEESKPRLVAAMVCPHTPGYACSRCAPGEVIEAHGVAGPALPAPVSGVVEPRGECDTCSTGYHDGCDYGPCACVTCHPAPGTDGATR